MTNEEVIKTADCSFCGVSMGTPCLSSVGSRRSPHSARRGDAEAIKAKQGKKKETTTTKVLTRDEEVVAAVSCPYCKASKGSWCTVEGNWRICKPHKARVDAADALRTPDTPTPEVRRLVLEVFERDSSGAQYRVHIKEQTHRCDAFTKKGDKSFKAKNGIYLHSYDYPAFDYEGLYTRGEDGDQDYTSFWVSLDALKKIKEALDDYNGTFGDKAAPPVVSVVYKNGTAPAPPTVTPRRLLLEVVTKCKGGGYDLKVKEQSHRGKEFGQESPEFKASNGVRLVTSASPEWRCNRNTLYVQGDSYKDDNSIFFVSSIDISKVIEAVLEYNNTLGCGAIFKAEDVVIWPDDIRHSSKTIRPDEDPTPVDESNTGTFFIFSVTGVCKGPFTEEQLMKWMREEPASSVVIEGRARTVKTILVPIE